MKESFSEKPIFTFENYLVKITHELEDRVSYMDFREFARSIRLQINKFIGSEEDNNIDIYTPLAAELIQVLSKGVDLMRTMKIDESRINEFSIAMAKIFTFNEEIITCIVLGYFDLVPWERQYWDLIRKIESSKKIMNELRREGFGHLIQE